MILKIEKPHALNSVIIVKATLCQTHFKIVK